ncbi:MAG: PA2779 family protein [Acidobacteriales bacterium]|nr:PA2779 family protein [Terriglobales bacterium]
MSNGFLKCIRAVITVAMAGVFAVSAGTSALAQSGTHVVSPSELQQQAVSATQTREQNLKTVQDFMSSDAARKALTDAHMDPDQVKKAAASLDDQELANLAAKSNKAQQDLAAGRISNRAILLIILAIAVIIVIAVLA